MCFGAKRSGLVAFVVRFTAREPVTGNVTYSSEVVPILRGDVSQLRVRQYKK